MQRFDDAAALTDLLERAGRLVQRLVYAEGMPPAQLQVLRYLARANRFSRTPTAIGSYLESTKGTVSQTIIALARKGLVRKERGRPDRRSVMLRLTSRGEAVLARDPLSELSAVVAALPLRTREALGSGLAGLVGAMLDKRAGRAFGQCANCRFFERGDARTSTGGVHRCGLLELPLSDDDATKICVEYERAA